MWWSCVFVKRDFSPMALKAKGERLSLICLGLVVVVLNSFGQCAAVTQTRSSKSSIVLGPHLNGDLNNGKEEQSTGAVRFGRLILGRNVKPRNASFSGDEHTVSKVRVSNVSLDDADYQSDMGWEPKQLGGHVYGTIRPSSPVVQSLLQMEPSVECVGDSMKLKFHDTGSTPGSLFSVDRGNKSPLPLSQLPTNCGHSISTTHQDWIFIAIYKGCYVTLEDGNYVLPMRWCGLPIKMSCPAKTFKPNPPTVSCYPEGMVVKMEGGTSAKDLRVKFKGHWQPLMRVSSHCGYSVVAHLEAVTISAHYEPCVELKDGMFTLELAGEGEFKVSCPSPVDQSFPRPNYPQTPVFPVPPTIALQPSPMFPPQPTSPPKPQAPLHPYYTKPAEKPKPATLPPGIPQYYFSFYPLPATPPPATKVPQGHEQHPDYRHPKPVTSSPPKDPQPPWYSESFYPRPAEPVTRMPGELPPATEAPNDKVYYPYDRYPYDPQPAKPVTRPPVIQRPATEKPTSPLHPYYTQPATLPPGNPQYYFSFYPLPATPPPATKVPQGHEQHPDYRHPKPVTGSPAEDYQIPWEFFDRQPAKPVTRTPVTVPTPAILPPATEKPTSPLRPYYPKPATLPPGNSQYYFSFYPLPPKPVTPPPQVSTPATKAPQGHVQHPYYPHPLYPPHPKPVTGSPPKDSQIPWDSFDPQPFKPAMYPVTQKPTPAMLPPATEKPTAPLHPYYPHHYQQFYPEPAKPITIPLRPATQTPEQTPLVVHTWIPAPQQPSHPRTTKAPPTVAPSSPQPGDSYPPHPGYCPAVCPTGFLTCCPMPISFHQHHHNHFGPVTSKDSGIIPAYPFKHTSDLFNYASVSGPTQATTTPQPITVQTVAPTKMTLTGFHDYWSQHGMRFSASLASYAQVPSDANKPSEPQSPKQSHFQPYNPQQPMRPYFEAPASDSNKPMAQQQPIQPYLPHNPQRLMHAYPLPYNPQGPVQPHGQAPVYSNKPLELKRPASDPSKPSEPQSLSSDLNKPLKPQPSKWPNYPFRPPMWYDPDMFYASKPLLQPHHQTQLSESAMQMHSTLEQLSPQEHPHGLLQPPRPVKELGGSLPSNSKGISSLQQQNPSGHQMPTHYGSLPIYYAGAKPSYPQKPAAKPSGKPSRSEFPESFEHYWKPIVPLGPNEGFHVSYPAQSAGGSYPAQSAGGSYPAQSAGGSYPAQSAGGSYPAQSAGGSYPAQSAGGSYPAQSAGGSYPAQSAGGSYPAQSAGGSYPAQSAGGSYPAQSAGGSYPAQSAGGSYPAQSAGGSYPAAN
ncbi:uncharacterized protein LOC118394427 [Oncorhynchus keta]|uniref:uncharacterized protein LOC118394427 n=1 Tax=Oncorhynchus keta TaxID=8018 RepID=UPI00227ADB4A|nr:uncharacterized protein LOC118394427 [Oncorhynchus keta]